MADNEQQARPLDVDGYEAITNALMDLLNQYPGIAYPALFASTDGNKGSLSMYPTTGGVIEAERVSITGRVRQSCAYPFLLVSVVSGQSGKQKAATKEQLDNIGRWLEGQSVKVGDETYTLDEYPTLTDGRTLTQIRRTSPAYISEEADNHDEAWVISLVARYDNNFQRR